MKKFKKISLYVLAFVLIFIIGNLLGIFLRKVFYFDFLPAYTIPEEIKEVYDCPICSHLETNPPILINTATGESRELRLYDYDIYNPKGI